MNADLPAVSGRDTLQFEGQGRASRKRLDPNERLRGETPEEMRVGRPATMDGKSLGSPSNVGRAIKSRKVSAAAHPLAASSAHTGTGPRIASAIGVRR